MSALTSLVKLSFPSLPALAPPFWARCSISRSVWVMLADGMSGGAALELPRKLLDHPLGGGAVVIELGQVLNY